MDAILASIRSMMSDGEAGRPSPSPVMEESRPVPAAGNVSKLFSEPPAGTGGHCPDAIVRPIDVYLRGDCRTTHPRRGGLPCSRIPLWNWRWCGPWRKRGRKSNAAEPKSKRRRPRGKSRRGRRRLPRFPGTPATTAGPRSAKHPERRLRSSVRSEQDQSPGPLLSREADAAVSSAFQDLATSVLSGSGRTIDDVVEDLLRPMLRDWLDDNLPSMVERLVREEIERVARGRR